ncbi:MAG TPA: N-acetylmuramoyl-L-alanine amidase [Bryobacteraceae bacterium]|nr:N-acetylmuramoyl-L-alanine amidase [Bryobacteraceae bacterium]
MKLLAALAVSIPMLVAQTERPALRSVTAVRHWSLADVTRVAVEVSGSFNFATERLHDPERVYFDIPDARPRIGARRGYSEQVEDKLLSRIRVAETAPGVTRIVLDLTGSVEAVASQLTTPDRLIVELRSLSAPSAPAVPTAVLADPPAVRQPAPVLTAPPVIKPEPRKFDPYVPPRTPTKTEVAGQNVPEPPEPGKLAVSVTPAPVVAPPPASEISKAARHTSSGQTSLVRALGLKLGRVVIDPGHGGHDQGTVGPKGLLEKDLVLDVAQRVGKLVADRLNSEVIYTRTDDTFVPLEGRTELANGKKADLFLSIHANSSPVPRIAGVETYYLNFTEAKDALDVAARENASSQKSIFELRDIIQTITLHDKAEESREFASRIQTALYGLSARNFPNAKNRGVKKAPFVVLIGANMPSVLAEIGFLSNAREESLLRKSDYRDKLAEAIFRGISRYADSLSHFQVAQAKN